MKEKYKTLTLDRDIKLLFACMTIVLIGLGFMMGHERGMNFYEKEICNKTNEVENYGNTNQNQIPNITISGNARIPLLEERSNTNSS